MVQQGDFTVQIVEAETKKPFLEHTKDDGMIFVEVEPHTDYYIAVQRTGCSSGSDYYLRFFVDGKCLGFQKRIRCRKESRPRFVGPLDKKDGVEMTYALKFSQPDTTYYVDTHFSLERFLREMGKVEVRVYACNFSSYNNMARGRNFSSSFSSSTAVGVSRLGNEKEKLVLSARQGDKKMVTHHSRSVLAGSASASGNKQNTSRGVLLDTITLRYCSTKGLCKVGILPDLPSRSISSTAYSSPRPAPGLISPSPAKKRRWKTEMMKICDEETPDGNVPSRVVEVIIPEGEDCRTRKKDGRG